MRRRLAYVAVLATAACATMPPVPAVPTWYDVRDTQIVIDDDERKLWEESKERRAALAEERGMVSDAALTAYLDKMIASLVSQPLPAQAPQPAVYVLRDAKRFAGAYPDGGIVITTSMLAAMQNEAQLVALLGHELGHFVARHQITQRRFAKTSRSTVERMRLSRQQETDSDRYALEAMRRTGYDPRELPRMLLLSEPEEGESALVDPFRSHPFIDQRIRDLNLATRAPRDATSRTEPRRSEPTPDAEETSRSGAEPYAQAIVGVLPIAAEVELQEGRLDRARESIDRLLALRPDSGRAYYLEGEHARLTERDGRQSASARRAYERAVELAPDDPDAVRALALLYHGDGNMAGATPLLEKYLLLVPDAPDRKLVERYLGRRSDAGAPEAAAQPPR